MPVPLDDAGAPGVVAVVRPMDWEEQAKWNDAFPGEDAKNVAAGTLVRQQLLRLDGLFLQAPGAEPVPYNHENATHRRALKTEWISAIYGALIKRAIIDPGAEKNSEPRSASVEASGSAASSAVDAASAPATS